MSIFDINGNIIASNDASSGGFIEKTVNLLDKTTVTYGKRFADSTYYVADSHCTFDVPVEYGKTYYSNITPTPVSSDKQNAIVASGLSGFQIFGLNESGKIVTNGISCDQPKYGYDSSGSALWHNYCIITINDSSVVKLRFTTLIEYSLTSYGDYNGMFSTEYSFPNINEIGVEYLTYEYGSNIYELLNANFTGLMEQVRSSALGSEIVSEKVLKSQPLFGKTVAFIGDSNTSYNAETYKEYFESNFGCTFYTKAAAGYCWETQDALGTETKDSSAVGQLNKIIDEFLVDSENRLLDENLVIVFMMGTNKGGELGDITSKDVSTVCGAIRHCIEKAVYYGRKIPIGVILPWCGQSNNELAQICEEFAVPYIDLTKDVRTISEYKTGTYTNENYYVVGNHLSANANIAFCRIIGKWVSYII